MRLLAFAPLLALAAAACGDATDGSNLASVDINATAGAAQGAIDTYAADSLETARPVTREVLRPVATIAAVPAVVAPAGDDAQAAASVVRHYYALIAAGRYRDAWLLWDRDGGAAGTGADAFAAGFGRYARYRATVGAPGAIDAGAGQRHVTVPVTVTGTLRAGGRPFALAGAVTLHRVGEIDGATEAQKSWHVSSVDLAPEGEPPPAAADGEKPDVDNVVAPTPGE